MDISATGMLAREIGLNKANTEQDIMQKTLEKSEDAKLIQQQGEPRPVENTTTDKQGRIDFYA